MNDEQLISLVEQAYALDASEDEWLASINALASRAHEAPFGAFTYTYQVQGAGQLDVGRAVHDSALATEPLLEGMFSSATPEVVHYFFRYGPPAGAFSDAVELQGAPAELAVSGKHMCRELGGLGDIFVVNVQGRDGYGLHITLPYREDLGRTRPAILERWARAASHLGAGLRLRQILANDDDGDAILDPSGDRVHATGEAREQSAGVALREAVRARDRARGRMRHEQPLEALEIWRGLIEGRWSLVDRVESDGRRYVIARRNEPGERDPRALSPREQHVATLLARGLSTKQIAYDLGLSSGRIGDLVASVVRKLGARNRTQLIGVLRSMPPLK